MPVNLNTLLNSTPVSPPHSQFHPSHSQGPSAIELANLLSPAVDSHRALPKQAHHQQQYSEHDEQQEDDDEHKQFREALQALPLTQPATHTLPVAAFNRSRPPRAAKLASYQRPVPFTSFSYDDHRLIRTGKHQFESLRPFSVPQNLVGFDLSHRIDRAVFRDESIDEGIDGLLISLIGFLDKADPKERLDLCRGVFSASLITWRGVLTKLCASVYETAGEGGGGGGGWTKEVMMVDGTVYMIDGPKTAEEQGGSSAQQTYYGHSYESLLTNPSGFEDVNTNTQWVSVVKSNLNGNRLILGGEVDCIDPNAFNHHRHQLAHNSDQPSETVPIDQFIEIKTSIMPASDRDHWNLYRFKMLKFWLQSYLLGVPKIHVGLRDRSGIVRGAQDYLTEEIPALVKQRQAKPGGRWSSEQCLETGGSIIGFVRDRLSKTAAPGARTRQSVCQARLDTIVSQEAARRRAESAHNHTGAGGLSDTCARQIAALAHWPVYTLRFRPPKNHSLPGTLELVERPADAVAHSVAQRMSDALFGFRHPLLNPHHHQHGGSRVGFLPSLWMSYLVLTRVQLALETETPSRNLYHST